MQSDLPQPLQRAARTLLSVGPALPVRDAIEQEMADAQNAVQRGYFLPDEDERVKSTYARYLSARAALHRNLRDLEPFVRGPRKLNDELFVKAFAIAFCNACMLMRSGRFIIDAFSAEPVIRQKLDEEEPRFGIPRKSFSRIYKSLTSTRHIVIFQEGLATARAHYTDLEALENDPDLGPIVDQLRRELPFIEPHLDYYVHQQNLYRLYTFLRRYRSGIQHITFALFKISGQAISEIRLLWRRKRVRPRIRERLRKHLRAGDVIVTRHDDALTNLFLPGFWPHGSLYIGTEEERRELGVDMTPDQHRSSTDPICVLEARKDGVLFRPLEDTLSVDCAVILRPRFTDEERRKALTLAITHEGKYYDFEFDFSRSDRLVCTELIYRGYHGIGPMNFTLQHRTGRYTFSAEDLLDTAIDQNYFDVIAIYGVRGNRIATGDKAQTQLAASYRK